VRFAGGCTRWLRCVGAMVSKVREDQSNKGSRRPLSLRSRQSIYRSLVVVCCDTDAGKDADVAHAARVGRRQVAAELKQAEDEERHVAIHGFGRRR
jgi:hypothetical protein